MWIDYGTKKNIATPGKAGYQSCIKIWSMVEHAKKVFWHHHTLHLQLSEQNGLAGTKTHIQLPLYIHTKNHHCYGHQFVDIGNSVRDYCMAFYGYHGSKCMEAKDAIQKYLSNDRKAITLYAKSPKFKTQKLGTIGILIIKKKMKISVPYFQSKFEVGGKKFFFSTMIQFLLLPFP